MRFCVTHVRLISDYLTTGRAGRVTNTGRFRAIRTQGIVNEHEIIIEIQLISETNGMDMTALVA